MSSRELIRTQTDDFLNNSSQSSSYRFESEEVGTTDHLKLTTAGESYLPMVIAMAGKDGDRIEFTMLINPESMNHGKTNTANFSYTRRGYVTQLWGPGQDTLTATGKTAMFLSPEEGLATIYAKKSFGFLNFMALFNAYRNNGYRLIDPSNPLIDEIRVISVIQGVEIYYDGQIYLGHFNTFTMDETADNPFILSYNFEFVISSNSARYDEIRGHFIPIPENRQVTNVYSNQEPLSDQDSIASGKSIRVVSDVQSMGPDTPLQELTAIDESSLYVLWQSITGQLWSSAFTEGYTDGSTRGNMKLKRRLISETWPFSP